jgi:hypothetical protein
VLRADAKFRRDVAPTERSLVRITQLTQNPFNNVEADHTVVSCRQHAPYRDLRCAFRLSRV